MWAWLRKWAGIVFGALAAVLLTVLTLGWWVRRKDDQIARLQDDKTVATAMREIDRLQAVREAVAERVGEQDEAIEHLDQQIHAQKRKVVEAGRGGEELSDDELQEAFKRALGR